MPRVPSLGRLIEDLQDLDDLCGKLEIRRYKQSDPDHAEKARLINEIADILQPLCPYLSGLAFHQSSIVTTSRLDEPACLARAAYGPGGYPCLTIAEIPGGERFNVLGFSPYEGYLLARQNLLDSGESGYELVFRLSDETASKFWVQNRADDGPEDRLTLAELQAINRALPLGLVRLSQYLDRTRAELRVAIEEATTAVDDPMVR